MGWADDTVARTCPLFLSSTLTHGSSCWSGGGGAVVCAKSLDAAAVLDGGRRRPLPTVFRKPANVRAGAFVVVVANPLISRTTCRRRVVLALMLWCLLVAGLLLALLLLGTPPLTPLTASKRGNAQMRMMRDDDER